MTAKVVSGVRLHSVPRANDLPCQHHKLDREGGETNERRGSTTNHQATPALPGHPCPQWMGVPLALVDELYGGPCVEAQETTSWPRAWDMLCDGYAPVEQVPHDEVRRATLRELAFQEIRRRR